MDDVLTTRNENGHLEANILFLDRQPTVEDMDGFDRILCFVKGKMTGGGGGGDIQRTEVFLNEENNYTEAHSAGKIDGDYDIIGQDAEKVNVSIDSETMTFTKSSSLTSPGTYTHVFAIVGEDWAEIFVVQIVVSASLRVRYNNVYHTNGQSITVNMTAPNYSPQYLYVFGSRSWILEGVDTAKVQVTPTSGSGFQNTWDSTLITIQKPTALVVTEPITTTFRILAQNQWVDVTVNFVPPVSMQFVDPLPSEEGVSGISDIYLYF